MNHKNPDHFSNLLTFRALDFSPVTSQRLQVARSQMRHKSRKAKLTECLHKRKEKFRSRASKKIEEEAVYQRMDRFLIRKFENKPCPSVDLPEMCLSMRYFKNSCNN
ncbi:hypothetical protein TNIN_419851 [Trichonephila inaurata madagascariensis]|uniref:Uncharacterized protein n=1 Tax=Trichonephila inaurata madagascariensis TaxID=2747483 RepID=A0A8X6X907_9ARAC|nr:hypothetical protein TNIN_419851 [Trichonephila inaurata madagascariensis]